MGSSASARRRNGSRASFEQARAELSARLHERGPEIEQAVLTRTFAVSDTNEPLDLDSLDPTYLQGLRTAIGAAVDYGLEVIERGEEPSKRPSEAACAGRLRPRPVSSAGSRRVRLRRRAERI